MTPAPPLPDLPRFGVRLRLAREARGYTMPQLAGRAGMTHPTIMKLESGKNEPMLRTALRLARALGMSLDELCGRYEGAGSAAEGDRP